MRNDYLNLRLFDGDAGHPAPASPTRPSEAVSEEEENEGTDTEFSRLRGNGVERVHSTM